MSVRLPNGIEFTEEELKKLEGVTNTEQIVRAVFALAEGKIVIANKLPLGSKAAELTYGKIGKEISKWMTEHLKSFGLPYEFNAGWTDYAFDTAGNLLVKTEMVSEKVLITIPAEKLREFEKQAKEEADAWFQNFLNDCKKAVTKD